MLSLTTCTHVSDNVEKQMISRFVTGFVIEFVSEFVTGIKSM